jgi:hypothetical protein
MTKFIPIQLIGFVILSLKLKQLNSIKTRRRSPQLTDEEMALHGIAPSAEEFEEWLTGLDKDKGSSGSIVRKRLIKKLNKEFAREKVIST